MEIAIRCGWCKTNMGTTNWDILDEILPPVTHSICPSCNEELKKQANSALKVKSFLADNILVPQMA